MRKHSKEEKVAETNIEDNPREQKNRSDQGFVSLALRQPYAGHRGDKYKVRFSPWVLTRILNRASLLVSDRKKCSVSRHIPLLIKANEKSMEKKASSAKALPFPWNPTVPLNCRIMSFFHGLVVNGARKKEIRISLVSYGKYNVRFFYSSFFLWSMTV
jgi:hypothetical protein